MKRCVAVLLALFVVAGVGVWYAQVNGLDDLPRQALRSTYPDYDEVSNWNFMAGQYDALAEAGENPQLVLGSSELNSAPAGAAHPGRLFAGGQYGISSVIAGRAGCNDLWQAIELGAFSDRLPAERKRVVVFTSMQWFMCYRKPSREFTGVFSPGAYQAFMENEDISQELKDRIAARVRAYGVTDTSPEGPLETAVAGVDAAASSLVSDLRLARKLREIGSDCSGSSSSSAGGSNNSTVAAGSSSSSANGAGDSDAAMPMDAAGEPDWERIAARADADARAASSNEYGFSDTWYHKKFDRWLAGAQKKWQVKDGEFFSKQEFEDFQLMLEVCRACGIEPLVVIQPVKGAAYDQTIYTREVREGYYDMIRGACASADVQVADFSDREYDTYFLRDYSHPSPVGSAAYSRAIYDFCR